MTAKVYVSQGGSYRSALPVNEVLGAATVSQIGGVYLATTIPDPNVTIPADAPAGGTGATAGAWDTAAHRDEAIATINGLVDAVTQLQAHVIVLQAVLRVSGVLPPA